MPYGRIYQWLRRSGFSVKHNNVGARRPPDPAHMERDRRIAAEYDSGLCAQEIAERHNLTRERVRQILKRDGCRMRSPRAARENMYARGRWPTKREPLEKALRREDEASQLKASGLTYSQIARRLGVSRSAVAGLIHRAAKREFP